MNLVYSFLCETVLLDLRSVFLFLGFLIVKVNTFYRISKFPPSVFVCCSTGLVTDSQNKDTANLVWDGANFYCRSRSPV